MPETILHIIDNVFLDKNYFHISKEKAIKLIQDSKNIVIKPSKDSYDGKNVISIDKITNDINLDELLDLYEGNCIIQKRIIQHDIFSRFRENCSCVIRITTLFYNNHFYICTPSLRIGDTGIFTDNGNRKVCIGINSNGFFSRTGLSYANGIDRIEEMENGFVFGNEIKCPGYYEMINIVRKIHPRMAKFRIIGWDFMININGNPVLIECNTNFPGIVKYQECNGPLFGDETEQILDCLLKNHI